VIAITVVFATEDYLAGMESAMQQPCIDCALRADRIFCDLPPQALASFDSLKTAILCPRNMILFREGQPARSVFVLCEGRARLTVCSESGKRLTLHVAGAGEVLGLSAALSGGEYEATAELLDNSRVACIKRKGLLHFLREHREACLRVVDLLSQDLHVAYDRVRSVGLGRTRRSRIAVV
jgi:CRP/FNR family transcriptional regulator, cyclic AMP receptor protein